MLKYLKEHIGSILGLIGIILAVIFWRFPITSGKNQEAKVVQYSSIFNLIEKISSEKTSLAKQNILIDYYNAPIKDRGFILDASKQDRGFIIVKIVKNLDKNEYDRYTAPQIECEFSEQWMKSILAKNVSDEIEFTGVIPNEDSSTNLFRLEIQNIPTLELDSCTIIS